MDVNYEMSDEAILDLHKAQCYFKLIQKDIAFMDDLLIQLRLIISMPKAFQIRYRNVRIVQLDNFNFTVHYIIFEGRIRILNILNQNQEY